MSKNSSVKTNNILLWIVGLCAFISFVVQGLLWFFGKVNLSLPGAGQILNIARMILSIGTLVAGIVWVMMTFKNKTARIVLLVILCVFAAMSILGLYW